MYMYTTSSLSSPVGGQENWAAIPTSGKVDLKICNKRQRRALYNDKQFNPRRGYIICKHKCI